MPQNSLRETLLGECNLKYFYGIQNYDIGITRLFTDYLVFLGPPLCVFTEEKKGKNINKINMNPQADLL